MSIDPRIESPASAPFARQSGSAAQRGWPENVGLLPAMLRTWSAARESGENPLPYMMRKAGVICPSPEVAVACASLFTLAEAAMGRMLVPECCCSKALSRDEHALLMLLREGPDARAVGAGRYAGPCRSALLGGGLETRH